MSIANIHIRDSFLAWLNDPKGPGKKFKTVLHTVSNQQRAKNGKGFVAIHFNSYDDYIVFLRDNSKAKVSYMVVKLEKIPGLFHQKYNSVNLSQQFLLYATFGEGDDQATIMDVVTP